MNSIQVYFGFLEFFNFEKTLTLVRSCYFDSWSHERGSVVVSTPAWHAGDLGSIPAPGMLYFRCKNLALNIRDCVSLCLSDATLKAVGLFYLVSMPGEVKYPTPEENV